MPGIQAALPASLGRSTGATVRRRRATVVAAAVVVGCFTFSYRFNTDEMQYVIDNSDATLVIVEAEDARVI